MEESRLILTLRRDDDLSDMNYFMEEHNLSEIDWEVYDKDPILYKCSFFNVKLGNEDIEKYIKMEIIDSEIHYKQNDNEYIIILSFSRESEVNIICTDCKVETNMAIINKYLDQNIESFPYCTQCNDKLLTKEKIIKHIRMIKEFV